MERMTISGLIFRQNSKYRFFPQWDFLHTPLSDMYRHCLENSSYWSQAGLRNNHTSRHNRSQKKLKTGYRCLANNPRIYAKKPL